MNMLVTKGYFTEDTLFYSWDKVPACRGESCVAASLCPNCDASTECSIQASFLKSLSSILQRNFMGKVSEVQLFGFGMHLMPLYRNLCSLYIEEAAVTAVTSTAKGFLKIHPVYKEIRDTILIIGKEWNRLGLIVSVEDNDLEKDGDIDYYSKLEESFDKVNHFKKKPVRKKMKRKS